MIEILHQVALLPFTRVTPRAIAIRDGEAPAPPPVSPAEGAACTRFQCNDALNGRLPGPAPSRALKPRWASPFLNGFEPTTVLQAGERVLAYGGGAWRLYDPDGKPLADGRMGASGAVLDPAHGLFYLFDRNQFLAAYRLADGGEELKLNAAPGEAWPFIARSGNRILDLGIQVPQPWRPVPPELAVLERLDLSDPVQVDDTRIVSNLAALEQLHFKPAETAQAAMQGDRLAVALPGMLLLASTDLRADAALEGDFTPRFLSLDEAQRAHLLVRSGEKNELWIVTPSGERGARVELTPEQGAPVAPAIIGYDHRVFLLHSGISAHDPNGALLWEKWPRGRVGGAGVTTDGRLLVSGGDLAAYDPQGERRVLFLLPGVSLVSSLAMSAAGEIFVASKDAVYCLAPQAQ